MNKTSFLNSIKQGVKDIGTIYNPVTAFNTIRPRITRSINNKITPGFMKKRNKMLKDEIDKL